MLSRLGVAVQTAVLSVGRIERNERSARFDSARNLDYRALNLGHPDYGRNLASPDALARLCAFFWPSLSRF